MKIKISFNWYNRFIKGLLHTVLQQKHDYISDINLTKTDYNLFSES